MKREILWAAVAGAALFLTSCSKSIILSDGVHTKKIWVDGKIELKRGENNTQVLSFESLNGTKYTIDASKYTYIIK
jgi:hypothetical protein